MMSQIAKDVRNHDFRRVDVIERFNLQAMQRLFEDFARSTTQKFTSTLHNPCFFEVLKIDQLTWGDLSSELENGMYFFTFSLSPLVGRVILAIPTDEVLALVDLRLAGSGDDDFSGRMPTEIDQAFLVMIIEDLINELGKAFARIQPTSPVLETQEGNMLFLAIPPPAEMCMAVRLSFQVANRLTRDILVCLPLPMARKLIDSLQVKTGSAGDGQFDSATADARRRLHEVPLNLIFQFPSILTTPAELLKLEVGDNLALGHPKGRPLEVRAEGILVALAEMCSSGVHKACAITEEVTK